MKNVTFSTLWDAISELLTSVWNYVLADERKMQALREEFEAEKDDPEEEEYLGI